MLRGDPNESEESFSAVEKKMKDTKDAEGGEKNRLAEAETTGPAPGDLENVSARKNMNETAFFFPHLVSGKDGKVRIEFTMPEALTKWKFLGFAHDNKLRSSLLTDSVVTAKDLMIQPNPPRFLREGDIVEFTCLLYTSDAADD